MRPCSRCARALGTSVHALDILIEDLGHRTTDRIVRAGRAARTNIQELLAAPLAAAASSDHRYSGHGQQASCQHLLDGMKLELHQESPPKSSMYLFL